MRSGHLSFLCLRMFVVLFIPFVTVASMPIGASAAPGSVADEWSPSLMQDKEQEKQERQQEKEQRNQEREQEKEQQKQIKEQEKQQREQEKEQQKQEKEQEKQERKEEREQQNDPGNECADWANLARATTSNIPFEDEEDCLAYINDGGIPVLLDRDGDGIPDVDDSKPFEPNDADGDGFEDELDNCPETANADQADTDGNGIGDACDESDSAPDPEPTVSLSKGSGCTLVVSVTRFAPGAYQGVLNPGGHDFSITVGQNGTGSSSPIGGLTNEVTYTATVGDVYSSDEFWLSCVIIG